MIDGVDDARRSDALALGAILLLVVARVVAVVVLLRSGVEHEGTILGGDVRRYLEILHADGMPYRDRAVEYTPLTLGFLALVDRSGVQATLTSIAWSQLALEIGVVALLWWAWSRRAALWYLVLGTPMIFFPFPYVRIDLLSVALAVAGMALVRRSRPSPGGAVIGLAVLTKIWPYAIAPVLLVRRSRRGVLAFALAVAVGILLWAAPFGTDGFGQVLSFRGASGWQIESLPGIVAHALDPGASTFQSGAWRSGATMPAWARATLLGATITVIAWAWWRADRTDASDRDDASDLAALLAVVAVLAFAPILSPQYVLWMLPFAAVVAARADRVTPVLAIVISALTTAGLASIHRLTDGDAWAIAIVAARNLALVALGLHLVRRLVLTAARRDDQPTGTS